MSIISLLWAIVVSAVVVDAVMEGGLLYFGDCRRQNMTPRAGAPSTPIERTA